MGWVGLGWVGVGDWKWVSVVFVNRMREGGRGECSVG